MNLNTAVAATRLGVAAVTVLRWLYGDRRADAAGQLACKRAFGIESELWFEKPKGKSAVALPIAGMRAAA